MNGPVRSYLTDRLRRALRKHLVVVWYDHEEAFKEVFRNGDFENAERISLTEDGYLRLRHQVEPFVSGFRAGLPAAAKPVLIYIPQRRLVENENILLPLEALGTKYDRTLAHVAQTALRDQVPTDKVREWLDLDGVTLEQLDELAEADTDVGPLATVFGDASPYEVGHRFLTRPEQLDQLDDIRLRGALRETLERAFGVNLPEDRDAEELRDVFAQRLLLREFVDDLREVPEELEHLVDESDAGRGQRAAVRELAEALRSHQGMTDAYRRWADDVVQAFSLEAFDLDPTQVGERDTFGFEERLALGEVIRLARDGSWAEAEELCGRRSRSFWARTDEVRRSQWMVVELALEVRAVALRGRKTLPDTDDPARLVRWYVGEDGEHPGWRVDRLLRELSSHRLAYVNEAELTRLVETARKEAADLEQAAAEKLSDLLGEDPESWSRLPQQTELFKERVAPLLDDGRKVVMILADGFRYEMGRALFDALEDEGAELDLGWAVATLPTITKVGMAALLPGAEEGMELQDEGDAVVAAIGGRRLPTIVERRGRLEDEYGDRVLDLTLDDCLGTSVERLEERLAAADLILLRSQDVDQIGETDSAQQAHTLMSHVEPGLQKAMQRLARVGAEAFVLAADHGYLLRTDLTDAMKLDVPAGECVELHRRCVIGRGLAQGPNHVRLRAADLGLKGDLEMAFPRGINVFKQGGGNLSYLHGGTSLQETVIPVLHYTPRPEREEAPDQKVTVSLSKKKISNAFFQVRVAYRGEDLFAQAEPRKLRVEVVKDDAVIGSAVEATAGFDEDRNEMAVSSGEETIAMMRLTQPLEGSGVLTLRVVDVRLGEVVTTKEVEYDLAF